MAAGSFLNAAQAREVDRACDRFENAWRNGERPRIEEYLVDQREPELSALLHQLLLSEWALRGDTGDVPELEEYCARFPAHQQRVHRAFREESDETERQGLPIRCPHCQQAVQTLDAESLSRMVCPACGSVFGLVDDQPAAMRAGTLESAGHFELRETIGMGAFGTVWKARDIELDRLVAIKIPHRRLPDQAAGEQFLREARATAQLRHPNIVTVLEVGRLDDRVYIATDLIEGYDLSDWLRTDRPPVNDAARLCAKLASALQHAHDHGVIHRDVKPSNVMVDVSGEPFLMDFGLAKRDAGEVTVTADGNLLGTPAYMSPEQARGEAHQADGRSDVYSLGVVLFELLTGERPFRGNARMLLNQILHEEAPGVRKLNSYVPRDLETICLKCLEKEPVRRYQTAGSLNEELRRFLRGEPVQARPISSIDRVWRWCRRQPVLAGLSATIASLLLLLAIAGPLVAFRQQRLTNNARWQGYRANMRAVASAMDSGNVASARQSLEAAPLEHRGWEWTHFENRLDGSDQVLAEHSDAVTGLEFIPNKRQFVTCSRDGSVRLFGYDESLSSVTSRALIENANSWSLLRVTPDGRRFVCAGSKQIGLFDAETGEHVATHTMPVGGWRVACSPDSRYYVAFSTNSELVHRWRTVDGTPAGSFESEKVGFSRGAYDPRGRYIAVRQSYGSLLLLDAATMGLAKRFTLQIEGEERDRKGWGTVVQFSPDGKLVAVGNAWPVNAAVLWNVEDGTATLLEGHGNSVDAVSFSPDGSRMVTLSSDRTGRLWDPKTKQLVAILDEHTEELSTSVIFSRDGRKIFTAAADKTIRVWDAETGMLVSMLLGHRDKINSLETSTDGRVLVSGDDQGEVRVWDPTASERSVMQGHTSYVYDCDVTADGRLVVSGAWDDTVRIWNADTGALLRTWKRPDVDGGTGFYQTVIRPDGKQVAANSARYIFLVDLTDSGQDSLILVPEKIHEDKIFDFDAGGKYLAAGNRGGIARVWDPRDGKLLKEWSEFAGPIRAVCLNASGTLLFTGHANGELYCLQVDQDGERRMIGKHDGAVTSITLSPDDRTLASASLDGTARVWKAAGWGAVAELNHHTRVYDLAFHPDGTRLATAAADNLIRLWDTSTWDEVVRLRGHGDYVHGVAFSGDGRRLVSGSGDRTVRVWDAVSR